MKGDVVNDLLAISEEPNVRIMETKALVCNVSPRASAWEGRSDCIESDDRGARKARA